MGYVVKMPKLGMEMESGVILEWHVDAGEAVDVDDVLVEIESEKAVTEVTAREAGVLREVYLEPGVSVEPGTSIGLIAAPDASIDDLRPASIPESPSPSSTTDAASGEAAEPSSGDSVSNDTDSPAHGDGFAGGVKSSPRARRRAAELDVELDTVEATGPDGSVIATDVDNAADTAHPETGSKADHAPLTPRARRAARKADIDPASIRGTGPNGAITTEDVNRAQRDGETPPPSEPDAVTSRGSGPRGAPTVRREREFSGMRQTIASRLTESYQKAVHVTVNREVAMDEILEAKAVVDRALDVDVSLNDLLVLALSATLDDHPAFNAHFVDGVHREYVDHNIAVAVDVDEGLITPVLRNVESMDLTTLARKRATAVDAALGGDYSTDDITGGTITITNLGVLGVDSFDPIINPPEVAILAVNRIREVAVPTADGVAAERQMTLGLSFDHRVVDGADAARFLDTLTSHLEDPWPLILARTSQ